MKKTFAVMLAALTLTAWPALAEKPEQKGLFEKATKAVIDIFSGDEHADDKGQGKALEQIDRNLDKHGGSHKGLENARNAVSGNKGKGRGRSGKRGRSSDDIKPSDVMEAIENTIGANDRYNN